MKPRTPLLIQHSSPSVREARVMVLSLQILGGLVNFRWGEGCEGEEEGERMGEKGRKEEKRKRTLSLMPIVW